MHNAMRTVASRRVVVRKGNRKTEHVGVRRKLFQLVPNCLPRTPYGTTKRVGRRPYMRGTMQYICVTVLFQRLIYL